MKTFFYDLFYHFYHFYLPHLYTAAIHHTCILHPSNTPIHCSHPPHLYTASIQHTCTLQPSTTTVHCSHPPHLYTASIQHTYTLQPSTTPVYCSYLPHLYTATINYCYDIIFQWHLLIQALCIDIICKKIVCKIDDVCTYGSCLCVLIILRKIRNFRFFYVVIFITFIILSLHGLSLIINLYLQSPCAMINYLLSFFM